MAHREPLPRRAGLSAGKASDVLMGAGYRRARLSALAAGGAFGSGSEMIFSSSQVRVLAEQLDFVAVTEMQFTFTLSAPGYQVPVLVIGWRQRRHSTGLFVAISSASPSGLS
jgi:hypothetical protein